MSTTMIDRHIESPAAWTRSTVSLDEGRLLLGPECVTEIEAAVDTLRANPLPVLALRPADFELGQAFRPEYESPLVQAHGRARPGGRRLDVPIDHRGTHRESPPPSPRPE